MKSRIFLTICAFVLGLSGVVVAWTGPTATPPSGNVAAPINVGSTDQVKDGGLGVDALSVFGNAYVQSNFGIGAVSPTQPFDLRGAMRQVMNTTYDVWIQGGASTSGGDDRNLAMVGFDEDSGDKLYINYNNEYAGGTYLGTPVCIGGDCRSSWPTVTDTGVTAGDLQFVTCSYDSPSALNSSDCTASCPSGYTVIGGGCSSHGSTQSRTYVTKNYPVSNNTGWYCQVILDYALTNASNAKTFANGYATCMPN